MPLRARIDERLGNSGPTLTHTVARMQRDGLLTLGFGLAAGGQTWSVAAACRL